MPLRRAALPCWILGNRTGVGDVRRNMIGSRLHAQLVALRRLQPRRFQFVLGLAFFVYAMRRVHHGSSPVGPRLSWKETATVFGVSPGSTARSGWRWRGAGNAFAGRGYDDRRGRAVAGYLTESAGSGPRFGKERSARLQVVCSDVEGLPAGGQGAGEPGAAGHPRTPLDTRSPLIDLHQRFNFRIVEESRWLLPAGAADREAGAEAVRCGPTCCVAVGPGAGARRAMLEGMADACRGYIIHWDAACHRFFSGMRKGLWSPPVPSWRSASSLRPWTTGTPSRTPRPRSETDARHASRR